MNFLRNLFGVGREQNQPSETQQQENQSSNWSLSRLIARYGPRVQEFLENLGRELAEQQRIAQQELHRQQQQQAQQVRQFYAFSGLPIITGNPYLDQMIFMSNGQHFQGNVSFGVGGLQFNFDFQPNHQGPLPTMEEVLRATFQQAQSTNAAPPTDRAAIRQLPTIRLTKERIEFKQKLQENIETDACSICIEDYKVDEKLIQLPCGHVFHGGCIMPWIKEHNTCPTCRYELPVEDPERERDRVQRMKERFTEEGLKIMEIASEDEVIFDRLYDIRSEMQKIHDQNTSKKLLSNLIGCGSYLETRLAKLDSLNISNNDSVRHLRKNEILKIQFLQEKIDSMKKEIESNIGQS
jgi:hypothetical protein